MLESEAKTKWCPFVRVLVTPQDASWQGNMLTNRGDVPADNTNTLCIGSQCALWVETDSEYHHGHCGMRR